MSISCSALEGTVTGKSLTSAVVGRSVELALAAADMLSDCANPALGISCNALDLAVAGGSLFATLDGKAFGAILLRGIMVNATLREAFVVQPTAAKHCGRRAICKFG